MLMMTNGREGIVSNQPKKLGDGEGGGGGGGRRGMCIVMNGREGTISHQPKKTGDGDGEGGGGARKMCIVMNGREGVKPCAPSTSSTPPSSGDSSLVSSVFPPEHPFHRLGGNSAPIQVSGHPFF